MTIMIGGGGLLVVPSQLVITESFSGALVGYDTLGEHGPITVSGGRGVGVTSEGRASVRQEAFAANQYVEFTIKTTLASRYAGAMLRASGTNYGDLTCYFVGGYSVDNLEIKPRRAGVDDSPQNDALGPGWQVDDVIRAEISGATISLYVNGNLELQWTDPSPIASGRPGIDLFGNAEIDDAEFGEL